MGEDGDAEAGRQRVRESRGEPPGATQEKRVQTADRTTTQTVLSADSALSDVSPARSSLSDVSRLTLAPDAEDTMVATSFAFEYVSHFLINS